MNETVVAKIFLLSIGLVLLVFSFLDPTDDQKIKLLTTSLSSLQQERLSWEEKNQALLIKINGFSADTLDRDLLEEVARDTLHYVKDGDILLREDELLP